MFFETTLLQSCISSCCCISCFSIYQLIYHRLLLYGKASIKLIARHQKEELAILEETNELNLLRCLFKIQTPRTRFILCHCLYKLGPRLVTLVSAFLNLALIWDMLQRRFSAFVALDTVSVEYMPIIILTSDCTIFLLHYVVATRSVYRTIVGMHAFKLVGDVCLGEPGQTTGMLIDRIQKSIMWTTRNLLQLLHSRHCHLNALKRIIALLTRLSDTQASHCQYVWTFSNNADYRLQNKLYPYEPIHTILSYWKKYDK